jgi:tripartite-type tricarboxylate transporter receptor subunit TctC
MKKLLAILLLLFASVVPAKEIVTIIYPFGAGDTMANWGRTLADEASKSQDQYTFLFDVKPGAGNSIAANHVLNTPNTILMSSAAYYIRPNFYPNNSYDIAKFKILAPMCYAPLAIVSGKHKSWNDVPADSATNIGSSGLGSTTHLFSLQIASRYPQMQIVPFKSTMETILATATGQIDLSTNFLGEAETWANDTGKKKVYILGTTGSKSIGNWPLLVNQGFPKALAKMSVPHQLTISGSTPNNRVKDLQDILINALRTTAVRKSYEIDHCQPINVKTDVDVQRWYQEELTHWKSLTQGVKLDNN